MSRRLILASLLIACLPVALASGARPLDAEHPAGVLFDRGQGSRAELRAQVEIDSDGRVAKATPEKATPEELRAGFTAALQALRFAPPINNGQPATGRTFVYMRACAENGARGGDPEFRYTGHGPAWLTPSAPWFPTAAARDGIEGKMTTRLRILPDGTAEFESLDVTRGGVKAQRAYRPSLEQWARQQRFAPERLDGQPQPGTMEAPMIFELGAGDGTPDSRRGAANPCNQGEVESDEDVKENSLFTLVDAPGSR